LDDRARNFIERSDAENQILNRILRIFLAEIHHIARDKTQRKVGILVNHNRRQRTDRWVNQEEEFGPFLSIVLIQQFKEVEDEAVAVVQGHIIAPERKVFTGKVFAVEGSVERMGVFTQEELQL